MAPLFILYGSATGNARAIAQELASQYSNTDMNDPKTNHNNNSGTSNNNRNHGLPIQVLASASRQQQSDSNNNLTTSRKMSRNLPCPFTHVICSDLDSFKKLCQPIWDVPPTSSSPNNPQLKQYGVLIITSTTGNGDAPENASKFARFVKKKVTDSSQLPFRHVAYAVLGLGDTNYDQFCAAAKLMDKKIHELGGTRVRSLVCADEATGLEEPVELWTESIVQDLAKACCTRVDAVYHSTCPSHAPMASSEQTMDHILLTPNSDVLLEQQDTTITTAVAEKEEEKVNVPIPNLDLVHKNDNNNSNNQNNIQQPLLHTSPQAFMTMDTLLQDNEEEKKSDLHYASSLSCTSPGVRYIQQLLSTTMIPCVQESTFPTNASLKRLHSCQFTLIEEEEGGDEHPQDEDMIHTSSSSSQRRKSRGMSMAEMDRMTISSGSSNTLHFTLTHPYDSTILHARYLTATSTTAAQACAQILLSNTSSNHNNNNSITSSLSWEHQLTLAKEVFESHLTLDDKDPTSTSVKNGKRVIELTLSLPDDYTLEYQPGDSIGILIPNNSSSISFILNMLKEQHNINPSKRISIDTNHPITLEEAMRYHFDISSTIQNEMICLLLAQHAMDPIEKAALNFLATDTQEGKLVYQQYIEEQKRSIVDLLRDFPSCKQIPLSSLIALLPLAIPRYYSVCSSPLGGIDVHENGAVDMTSQKLTIAFSVVDYMTPCTIQSETHGNISLARRVGGLATRYLETICSPFLSPSQSFDGTGNIELPTWQSITPRIKIFPRPTSEFLLPSDWSTPLILFGPGTGIAPFMGFLAHRRGQILSSSSTSEATVGTWRGNYEVEEDELISESNSAYNFRKKLGEVDVYFGCRFQDHDWLYREEMLLLQEEGIITNLNVCFSRESKNGIKYVQDFLSRNSECSKRLVSLVEKNASIYICGDGNKMAKDVQHAIINVFAHELFSDCSSVDLTTESVSKAKTFVDNLKANGRFLLDIWS